MGRRKKSSLKLLLRFIEWFQVKTRRDTCKDSVVSQGYSATCSSVYESRSFAIWRFANFTIFDRLDVWKFGIFIYSIGIILVRACSAV